MPHRCTCCTQSKKSLDTFSVDVGDGGVLERVAVGSRDRTIGERESWRNLPERVHLEVGILRNIRDG